MTYVWTVNLYISMPISVWRISFLTQMNLWNPVIQGDEGEQQPGRVINTNNMHGNIDSH